MSSTNPAEMPKSSLFENAKCKNCGEQKECLVATGICSDCSNLVEPSENYNN